MKLAFGLDLNKCTGCSSCQIACNNENNLPPTIRWRQIIVFNRQRIPHLPVISYSMACNHCVEPPCHKNCPAQAYEINEQTGAVTINQDKCMGCKYCQWVCPYDAPSFEESAGVMGKCTFCSHLPDAEEPICVNVCPTGALTLDSYREDRGEEESAPDIWRSHIKPALMVKPVNEDAMVPKYSQKNDYTWLNQYLGKLKRKPESAVSLKTEWSLLIFTMGAPLLVAAFVAQAINRFDIPPLSYALIGFSCMVISTIHLGRKTQCFRALLNWKRSWLSREIIFFFVFLFASSVILFARIQMPIMNYLILITGILALFSIDQVYLIDSNMLKDRFHSASVIFIGIYLTVLFVYNVPLLVIAGLLKISSYLRRITIADLAAYGIALLIARMLFSCVIPGILLIISPATFKYPVIISVLIGEILARVEFYRELEFMRPQTKAQMDLEKMIL